MRIVLLLVVALAACTAPSASTTTVTAAPSSTTTTLPTPEEAVTAFVECLRDAGAIDADLEGGLEAAASVLDTTDPVVRDAVAGCASFLGPAQADALSADPEVRTLVAEQLRLFAECMRENGVEGFPDPADDLAFPSESIPFDVPGFDEAMETCRELVGSFGAG